MSWVRRHCNPNAIPFFIILGPCSTKGQTVTVPKILFTFGQSVAQVDKKKKSKILSLQAQDKSGHSTREIICRLGKHQAQCLLSLLSL